MRKLCNECDQLSYDDCGRREEGYAFCKIKCSWVVLSAKCWEVPLCNHEHFRKHPKEIPEIYRNWHKFLMDYNGVDYDRECIYKNLDKNVRLCDGCRDVDKPDCNCTSKLRLARNQRLIKHPLRYEQMKDSIRIDKPTVVEIGEWIK